MCYAEVVGHGSVANKIRISGWLAKFISPH